MTRAVAPDGKDAFIAIADRLSAVKRPVDSVAAIADQLPAGAEFKHFAGCLDLAITAYEAYLKADLRASILAGNDAINEARASGLSLASH